MKILMICPEPFFEPRGTPFSEYYRVKALSQLGHQVHMVTYPFGKDRKIPGLKIIRHWRPPLIRSIGTGPSFAKLVLDFFLFFKALRCIMREKFDLIHTHEEANIMGVVLNRLSRTPHLYDMHSSLVQQMDNFTFTRSRLVKAVFGWIEKKSLKNATSVIVICRSLFDHAAAICGPEKITLIENFMEERPEIIGREKLTAKRSELAGPDEKIILYTGTLEEYQGIPLLLDSLKYLHERYVLVLVGGKEHQVERFRKKATEMGVVARIRFLGQQDFLEIPYFLQCADVLVSPRIKGTNIPLKIYSYLKSGTPVVATDLYTHTQSINDKIAILCKPDPESLAGSIEEAVSEKGREVARAAVDYSAKHFSPDRYQDLVAESLSKLQARK